MKVLLVYDSGYGNTEKVANAIAGVLNELGEVRVVRPDAVGDDGLSGVGLLVVGSPTQGGMATKPVQQFLNALPSGGLGGIRTAAFDTGMKMWIARLLGYASKRIAGKLKKTGGEQVAAPAVFFVKDKPGPLADGELERARQWAGEIVNKVKEG